MVECLGLRGERRQRPGIQGAGGKLSWDQHQEGWEGVLLELSGRHETLTCPQ